MLKIRFQRTGRKNDPAYRIVVIEHTSGPRAGNNVAIVGSYHPKTKEAIIDGDAIKMWLDRGAQASGTVHNLLISKGIIEGKKINVLPRKSPIVKEEEAKEEPAKEAEAPADDVVVVDAAPADEVAPTEPEEEKKEESAAEEVPAPEAPVEPVAEEEKK